MNASLRILSFLFFIAPFAFAGPAVNAISPTLPDTINSPSVRLSHDGNRVIYLAHGEGEDLSILYSVSINGGLRTRLSLAGEDVKDFKVSPTTNHVFYRAIPFIGNTLNLYRLESTGENRFNIGGSMAAGSYGVYRYDFVDENSQLAFIATKDSALRIELYITPVEGNGLSQKLSAPLVAGGHVLALDESEDGSRLLYLADQRINDVHELFSVPIGGGDPIKVSPALGVGEQISNWITSPSGRLIIHTTPDLKIYRSSIYGGPIALLQDQVRQFALTTDENAVISTSAEPANPERFFLYRTELEPLSQPERIDQHLEYTVGSFKLTEDGQWLIYDASPVDEQGGEIFRMRPNGISSARLSKVPVYDENPNSTDGVRGFQITPDQQGVFYTFFEDGPSSSKEYLTNINTGRNTIVTNRANAWFSRKNWIHPDPERFFFIAKGDLDHAQLFTFQTIEGVGMSNEPIQLSADLPHGSNVSSFLVHPDGYRVVYVVSNRAVSNGYQLFVSHARAHWKSGNGSFGDQFSWDLGKVPDDAVEAIISDPGFVSLSGNRRVAKLVLGDGDQPGHSRLHLTDNARLTTRFGTNIKDSGILSGTGHLSNGGHKLYIASDGMIEVFDDESLTLEHGEVSNKGIIVAFGTPFDPARLNFTDEVINADPTSVIAARNANLRFDGGLDNKGTLALTLGLNDILGNIENTGSIVVTGGSMTTFHGDVQNSSTMQVSASGDLDSIAIFLGDFSGKGISGTGHVFLEGDTRPGFSPGVMAFGGNLSQGPDSNLHIEIGGTKAGDEYDRLKVDGTLRLGGHLQLTLIDGFQPQAGDTFDIWDAGNHDGSFLSVNLPALSDGLFWITSSLESTGELSVSNTPASYPQFSFHYQLEETPEGDDDGDGHSNLLEYALGLNPVEPDSADFSISRTEGVDGFSFSMPRHGGEDLTLRIQSSTDLIVWETRAIRNSGTDNWQVIQPSVLSVIDIESSGQERISLGAIPNEEAAKGFFRLFLTLDD